MTIMRNDGSISVRGVFPICAQHSKTFPCIRFYPFLFSKPFPYLKWNQTMII